MSKVAAPAASYAANCRQQTVAYPALVKREDLGVRTGKWASVAKEANGRIEAGNACIDTVTGTNGAAK